MAARFDRIVVDHHGVLRPEIHFAENLRQIFGLAAEIDPPGGKIVERDLPLDDPVPVGDDELLVVFADDGQQDAAFFQG